MTQYQEFIFVQISFWIDFDTAKPINNLCDVQQPHREGLPVKTSAAQEALELDCKVQTHGSELIKNYS